MARFQIVLGVFMNFLARKGRESQGYVVEIMKVNENNDWTVEISKG
jgi:hypothetical protein